ncbi:MAG: hypothetical protein PUB98_00765 [Clostridiales bacterium]|nr:hypothetical protein [Clostridiales bacterium]
MIPARIEQFLKTLPEPDFFIGKNRTAADEIHDLRRQYVDQGTATIAVNVDVELLMQVDAVLRGFGWTAEEAMVLFCMWCIVCPDRLSTWCGTERRLSISQSAPSTASGIILPGITLRVLSSGRMASPDARSSERMHLS